MKRRKLDRNAGIVGDGGGRAPGGYGSDGVLIGEAEAVGICGCQRGLTQHVIGEGKALCLLPRRPGHGGLNGLPEHELASHLLDHRAHRSPDCRGTHAPRQPLQSVGDAIDSIIGPGVQHLPGEQQPQRR